MLNSTRRVSDCVQLVRSEFLEMPGLCLTKAQAQRLWGFDPLVGEAVLEALVDADFLRCTRDGLYVRAGNGTAMRRPVRPVGSQFRRA